jgi:hypothetical protein
MCGGSELARISSRLQHWSVQPCVRPLCAVHVTAGHNALRGSGPGQKLAFDNALAQAGCPDRRRAISGSRLSLGSAATPSSCSTPLRPTGATMPNSAKRAPIIDHRNLLADEQVTGTMQRWAALLLDCLGSYQLQERKSLDDRNGQPARGGKRPFPSSELDRRRSKARNNTRDILPWRANAPHPGAKENLLARLTRADVPIAPAAVGAFPRSTCRR